MIRPTPSLLVSTANAFVGLGENPLLVDSFLRECTGEGRSDTAQAWDAAFVHHAGFWSHYDVRDEASGWPVPPQMRAGELAEWARKRGLARHAASVGDLFLLWSEAAGAYVRVGIIADVEEEVEIDRDRWDTRCVTIEGNTGANLQLGGGQVMRHKRSLSARRGDLFIDWAAVPSKEFA